MEKVSLCLRSGSERWFWVGLVGGRLAGGCAGQVGPDGLGETRDAGRGSHVCCVGGRKCTYFYKENEMRWQ